jgi:hypothetical protein
LATTLKGREIGKRIRTTSSDRIMMITAEGGAI